MQIGGHGSQRGHGHGALRRGRGHERTVPVDFHVGADPDPPVGAQELSREIRDDGLVLPRREAEIRNHGPPLAGRIRYLHLQRDDVQRG